MVELPADESAAEGGSAAEHDVAQSNEQTDASMEEAVAFFAAVAVVEAVAVRQPPTTATAVVTPEPFRMETVEDSSCY